MEQTNASIEEARAPAPPAPNAEFIQCWEDIIAPKFERFREVFLARGRLHSGPALERWGPATGERVLDVACGWGDTTLELARRVGPAGRVVGQDAVPSFLRRGEDLAREERLTNVEFCVGDAQRQRHEERFDLVFSRFGTMFFASPVAALRNIGAHLEPGGRLMMITWRAIEENTWLELPKRVARRHLPPPPDHAITCGPGPFSMSSPSVVRAILEAAGFDDVKLEPNDALAPMGGSVGAAVDQMMTIGPAGEIVREAGALGERLRPLIEDDLAAALAPYRDAAGGVEMPSSSWIVRARRG